MTAVADPIGALVQHLKNDADTSSLVGTRIFGTELPRDESDSMPRKCVVLSPSGGTIPAYAAATVPIQVFRLDIYCYGENPYEADRVRRAVYGALKRTKRAVVSNVMIHWARPAGGHAHQRMPETNWPFAWNSWQVLSDERTFS